MARPTTNAGLDPSRPIIVGTENGHPAIKVVATGLISGMRKGHERWVAGTGVDAEIEAGTFVQLHGAGPAAERPLPEPSRTFRLEQRIATLEAQLAMLADRFDTVIDGGAIRVTLSDSAQDTAALVAAQHADGADEVNGAPVASEAQETTEGPDAALLAAQPARKATATTTAGRSARAEASAQARMSKAADQL